MEQTIQIKRNLTDATAVPSSLKGGELAVNAKDRALFVGDGSSVVKLYTGDSKYFDSKGAANKAVAAVDEGFKIGNLYLKYDSTNNAIYVEGGNFYATEEVSAFGYGGIVDDDDSGSGTIDTTYLVTTNTIQTISASKTFTSTVKYNPSFYTYNAEDIEYRTTSGTLFGGIGAVHNGNTVSYFYMGTGTTPWNGSTGLVVGEELGFNGYQVWHSGNIQPITKHQDLSNYVKLTGALKNPYTLTWSGYSSGSYDGSAAASITIPTLDGYVNTITTTGSGNAITAASKSGSTITFTKGTTFLTAHQAIYNLTFQAGVFGAKTFDPNGAAATVNIPTTTSHISEGSNLYFTNARVTSLLKTLTIKNSESVTVLTYNPATANSLTLTKGLVGLSNVENTALSTWGGSSNIKTVGTITSGTWNGSAIANGYISSVDWSKITSKPTTLSGYGITDAVVKWYEGAFTPAEAEVSSTAIRDIIGKGYRLARGSWSYAGNGYLTTSFGVIDLAGASITQWGTNQYTQLFITAPTGSHGLKGEMLYYVNNGDGYLPTWYRVLTNSNFSSYALPLTGGTLTSSTRVPLIIKSTYTSGYSAIRFLSSTSGAYFAMNKSGNFIVTDTTWTTEYSILHSGNYNSYAPTLTGGGASGTWGINITGSSNYITVQDIRNTTILPNSGDDISKVRFWFNNTGTPNGGQWWSTMRVSGWTNDSYCVWELSGFSSNYAPTTGIEGSLWWRNGVASTWNSWKKILDSSNYTSYTYSQSTIDSKLSGYQPLSTAINTGNIGSQSVNYAASAGNADTLDGYHATYETSPNTIPIRSSNGMIQTVGIYSGVNSLAKDEAPYVFGGNSAHIAVRDVYGYNLVGSNNYGCVLDIQSRPSHWHKQIFFDSGGNTMYVRGATFNQTTWNCGWQQLAFITDNVASATKLQTARTIWGQSFDGTGNVTGSLYIPNGYSIYWTDNSGTRRAMFALDGSNNVILGYGSAGAGYNTHIDGCNLYLRYGTSHSVGIALTSSGNVGIGTTSPSYKLHVAGTMYASGTVTFASTLSVTSTIYSATGIYTAGYVTAQKSASDMRLKTVLDSNYDALSMLNNLSTFTYKWNDTARNVTDSSLTDNYIHYGLSAQELQNISETFIDTPRIDDKYLILNKAELVPVLVQAIKQLSQELKELKTKLK